LRKGLADGDEEIKWKLGLKKAIFLKNRSRQGHSTKPRVLGGAIGGPFNCVLSRSIPPR